MLLLSRFRQKFYAGEDVKRGDIKARFEDGTLKLQVSKKNQETVVESTNYMQIEGRRRQVIKY